MAEIIKMGIRFEEHLGAALGWAGAAQFLQEHGEEALNDELKRRGIRQRVRKSFVGHEVLAGQSESIPQDDPMFPGMGLKMSPATAKQVARGRATDANRRKSVNGYDPMFPGMQVPLKK